MLGRAATLSTLNGSALNGGVSKTGGRPSPGDLEVGDEQSSISSTSNETDADEYHLLIDDSCKKRSAKRYEFSPVTRRGPTLPGLKRGASSISAASFRCSRNRAFLITMVLFGCATVLLMEVVPLGSEKGRVGTIVGWSVNTSRQTVNYVLPAENTTLLEPLNVCSTEERSGDDGENEKVFLLIVVCSSASNFEARQTIRETWGNVSEFNYGQFARMHARFKGEYLEARSFAKMQDYMRRETDDGFIAQNERTSREKEHTNSDSKRPGDQSQSNKSSHDSTNETGAPLPTGAANERLPSFNVKVVFLLGQSEAEYLYQQTLSRLSKHGTVVATLPSNQDDAVERQTLVGAVADDADPAINAAELDEVQMRVVNESEMYGDIIQESFIDSYNNLTLKTIMMLKWVVNNCDGRVKYIVKCDDDTFVNVPNLLQVLLGGTVPLYKASIPFYDRNTIAVTAKKNRLVEVKRLLTGFLFCEVKPIADTSSKWYSPNYMYSKEFYPHYLSGASYLMNLEAAKLLYRTSLTTPIFHLEDVYLTGIVADRVKLHRYHHPLFFYSYTKDLCALRGMISQHQLQPGDIRSAYDFVTNATVVCKGPEPNFSMARMKLQQRKKCQ
ncbi:uncharacterized protein LOC129718261 [Wyeomyia smithii]|uniref:uncharacterized protein LOC129718261 n=1 Tax=Wyeomyia smithii TaxID=174621 RepID=UPI002467D035|nr:uncharacterized protein LOC129718261 [Wyeomyia smithii]XP_055524831.1 uncharacterized protein LOC129718261 [Wyeomyia smithii]